MIAMKKRMRALMLVTVLGAGVSAMGVALTQGGIVGTMNVEPTTVEPGGSYVISNDPESPCMLGQVSGDTGGVRPGAWFTVPEGNGDWSVTIEVPESGPPDPMGNPTPFPEGEYEQHAFCEPPDAAGFAAVGGPVAFNYEPVMVNVVAPAQEEPTTTTTTPPAAALPAAAEPSFTG